MKMWFIFNIAIVLWMFPMVKGEHRDCEDRPPYPRIFVVKVSGSSYISPSRQIAAEWLGNCRSVDEHINKMVDYFESYGIDLNGLKDDAFSTYTTPDFSVSSYALNPAADSKLVAATFYEYASAPNTRAPWISWVLAANKDLRGPRGEMKAGQIQAYGMYRLIDKDEEICIEYTLTEAVPFPRGPGPLVFIMKSWDKVDSSDFSL